MKKTLDRLQLARDIVEKRFSFDDENYGLFVCGCFCLLGKYGDTFLSLVEKVFNESNFVISDDNVLKLAEEMGINEFSFADLDSNELKFIDGLSFNGIHYYFNYDGKVNKDFSNPVVIISSIGMNNNILLNTFIHEVNHLIKSQIDAEFCEEFNFYSVRCGLSLYEVNYSNGILIDNNLFNTLDEIINVYQTTDMMIYLEELKDLNFNDNIGKFLSMIDYSSLDLLSGYNGLVEVFNDLWDNDEFRNIVEDDIITGNLDNIVNNFNNIMGRDCFLEFSNLCDEFACVESVEEYKSFENDVNLIINEFNIKTSYQYKK